MRQVHEYVVDKAKLTARIGQVNPKRTYVNRIEKIIDGVPVLDSEGRQTFDVEIVNAQHLDGVTRFFDQGGEPLEADDVPAYVHDSLYKNPLRRGEQSIEQVLKFCPYCPAPGDAISSNEYEAHLVKHLKAAGVEAPSKVTAPPAAKDRRKK